MVAPVHNFDPKIYYICRTWAAHVKGLFLSTGTQRPKLCTGATIFLFLFSIVFGSFLFIILFPFYSPFQFLLILLFLSLLILLVGVILRLPFLLLLYFKLFVDLQTCILMIYVHISVILRGFSKGPSLFYLLILLYCTLFFLFLFFSSYI